jgi:hypothetical protein
MEMTEKISRIEAFKNNLISWRRSRDSETRSFINKNSVWVRREVIEAGCFRTLTISPPPAIGGLVMQNVDLFDVIFDPPYEVNVTRMLVDMLDQTLGVLQDSSAERDKDTPGVMVEPNIQKGYAFIAMPIDPTDPQLEDVLDAVKEATRRCGIQAERVDEPHSNEKITDRILESIEKAEFVIVDLTGSRPNVFYEAGYAQGLRKTPIYIARVGTKLEFDLKDYPIIFFKNMKELKDSLEQRLRGIAKDHAK